VLQTNKYLNNLYNKLAEVPDAARVNLQPAEHLKNVSLSAFKVSSPPGPGGEGAGLNLDQNLPWTGGDARGKFHQIGAGVWISISPPHTNRLTNKQTSVRPFLYMQIK